MIGVGDREPGGAGSHQKPLCEGLRQCFISLPRPRVLGVPFTRTLGPTPMHAYLCAQAHIHACVCAVYRKEETRAGHRGRRNRCGGSLLSRCGGRGVPVGSSSWPASTEERAFSIVISTPRIPKVLPISPGSVCRDPACGLPRPQLCFLLQGGRGGGGRSLLLITGGEVPMNR